MCVLDEEVYEIPFYKIKNDKFPRAELACQTVIMMEMTYETRNRKPFKINRITFDRVSFDDQGIYDSRGASNTKEFGVKLEYLFFNLYETFDPLPIPIAPIIPTEKEIAAIKAYLDRKYPALLRNSPTAIEHWILKRIENHRKEIKMMKASHRK